MLDGMGVGWGGGGTVLSSFVLLDLRFIILVAEQYDRSTN